MGARGAPPPRVRAPLVPTQTDTAAAEPPLAVVTDPAGATAEAEEAANKAANKAKKAKKAVASYSRITSLLLLPLLRMRRRLRRRMPLLLLQVRLHDAHLDVAVQVEVCKQRLGNQFFITL